MRLRVLFGAAVGMVVLMVSYLVADAADVVPGILTRQNQLAQVPSFLDGTAGAAAYQRSGTSPQIAPGLITPALGSKAAMPSASGLEAALKKVLADRALGPAPGVIIRDATTGTILLQRQPDAPMTPASTTKLLSAAAMAAGSNLEARIPTSVVLSGPQAITLVGLGDTLLGEGTDVPTSVVGRAGVATLANQTASALRAKKLTSVTLALDDTFASGPRLGPGWSQNDVDAGLTSPITVLALASKRATPGKPAPSDPPMATAESFAAALSLRGITVQGKPVRAKAPAKAPVLGTVLSATVREQLIFALDESDNALTELLVRRAAVLAGQPSDFAAVTTWVRTKVASLGIPLRNAVLVDASGLSRGTVLTPRTISELVQVAASGRNPPLSAVVGGLPIAGLTGTLKERFTDPPSSLAAGVARAKTGTLTGASSLAGYVTTVDGRLLTYTIIADKVPSFAGTLGARRALDAVVAALAQCGCR